MLRRPRFVGYAQSALQNGATMVAPQFLPVTGGNITLESIAPTGDDVADNVAIQTLDAFGRTVDTYSWNDWVAETACWVNDDFEEVTGVTFPAGQGLWVFGSASAQGLQTAGKVGKEDVSVQLQNGATGTGNPFPVAIDLNDIIPTGDDVADNVAIQTLDAFGRTVDTYSWNDWVAETPCWVNDDFEPLEDVSFVAGQGLWVFGSSEAQYLRFPAPEF